MLDVCCTPPSPPSAVSLLKPQFSQGSEFLTKRVKRIGGADNMNFQLRLGGATRQRSLCKEPSWTCVMRWGVAAVTFVVDKGNHGNPENPCLHSPEWVQLMWEETCQG